MLVGPTTIAVSASTAQTAPSALFNLQLSNPGATELQWRVQYDTVGIDSVTVDPNETIQQGSIRFKSPGSLGAGVYQDTIEVSVCYMPACTQQIQGSPQTVSVQYTVTAGALVLNSTFPSAVTVGGPPFTLTVLGNGFSKSTSVLWNGSPRTTTFVSDTELLAQIAATDIATSGSAEITVQDPQAPNGTPGPQAVAVGPASVDATAFQINPAHTGAVSFSSVSFPAAPAWSVNVGGSPSYALIANGDVFVTVLLPSGDSELRALSQATGATVWGPIAIPGPGVATATYDNGYVFVASQSGSDSLLQAFDASTGRQVWYENASYYNLSGQFGVPTALEGLVFVEAAATQSSGGLVGVDETTGAEEWEDPIASASYSGPAVTGDGVYVSYQCGTSDYRPAMGEFVWSASPAAGSSSAASCSLPGWMAAPSVGNQLVFSPVGGANGPGGYGGSILAAGSGVLASSYPTYPYPWPPAITSSMEYFLSGPLIAVSAADGSVQWTFTGDGSLIGGPIVVNQYVIVGSSSGNIYALDGATGAQVWTQALPAGIGTESFSMPFGLAAGDGLLVTPAGNDVVAYVLSP